MRRHTSKMHYKEDDLVGDFDKMAVLCTPFPFSVGNNFLVFIPMQVKRTLFINGISKYAEETEIKQHFE